MKDIKTSLKLLTYGLQFKTMVFMFVVFFSLGIMFEFISDTMGNLSGVYLVLNGSYMFQLIMTSTVSNYICSSQIKRKLQTSMPSLLSVILTLICYTIFVAIRVTRFAVTGADAEVVRLGFEGFVTVGLLALCLAIYNAFAYKFFGKSVVVMLVIMLPLVILSMRGTSLGIIPAFSNNWIYAILGYVLIVLGGFLSYGFSVLFYKKELDPRTYRSALTRAGR